jgi:hypothetical protein
VHYEVWRDGRPVNPVLYLGPRRETERLAAARRAEEREE